MPLKSDITLASNRLEPRAISQQTLRLNDSIRERTAATPPWWEVGPEKHQEMRLNGATAIPKPGYLPQGEDLAVPSRDAGREIPCRVFYPSKSAAGKRSKGLFLFIHGGGWCFMSEKTSDTFLQFYADLSGCAAVNVGYRLAPKNPFPAGPNDCYDAAEYFVQNAGRLYGGPLNFIAGESAGAHLAALTTFHLLSAHPDFRLGGGVILHFGIFDLSMLPSMFTIADPPGLTLDMMRHYIDAFTPGKTGDERKHPCISPLYQSMENFRRHGGLSRLPSALFTCGTNDPLLDDTVFMGAKWMMAGGEAVVRLYEGAHHGFNGLSSEKSENAARVTEDVETFILDRLAKTVE